MLYQQVMLLPPALLVLSINYGEPYLSKTYTKLFLNCLSIVHTLLLARRLAPFPFQRQKNTTPIGVAAHLCNSIG